MLVVGGQQGQNVGLLGCVRNAHDFEAIGRRRLPSRASGLARHDDVAAAVPQVQRVRVALAAIADYADKLAFEK
jgi:hypothetical protein